MSVTVYLKKNNTRKRRLTGCKLISRVNDNILLLGARNSGKSNIIHNYISKCLDSRTHVFIFSSTGSQLDPTYKSMKKIMDKRNIPYDFYNTHDSETELLTELIEVIEFIKNNQDWDPVADYKEEYQAYRDALREMRENKKNDRQEEKKPLWGGGAKFKCNNDYDYMHAITSQLHGTGEDQDDEPQADPTKPKPLYISKLPTIKFLLIFDDVPKSILNKPEMLTLMRTNRHLKACVILSIQHMIQLNKRIYGQMTNLLLFKNISKDDIFNLNRTRINIANSKTIQEIYKIYQEFTKKHYDFANINILDQTIKHNFDIHALPT